MHLYSADVQQRNISGNLNAVMLQHVLIGIYTMVYIPTMYLYISRNKPNLRIVVSIMTVLYVLSLIGAIIQWCWSDQWMVHNGATRHTVFLSTIKGGAPSLYAVYDFVFTSGYALSDAFLIWRCYGIWGMSRRIVAVPSAIFIAEFALLVASVILSPNGLPLNERLTRQYNNVVSGFVMTSLATTVITTSLIGYRIHTVASMNSSGSKRTLKHIMTIILESAIIYSVMLVAFAITTIVPSFINAGSPEVVAVYYIESIGNIVSGMAPTILMARIALKRADTEQIFTSTASPRIPDSFVSGSGPISGEQIKEETGTVAIQANERGDR